MTSDHSAGTVSKNLACESITSLVKVHVLYRNPQLKHLSFLGHARFTGVGALKGVY